VERGREAPNGAFDAVGLVADLLTKAVEAGASDIHFEPTRQGMVVRFRLDGVLKTVERVPEQIGESVVARLKVLGGLLTYRTDIPQEGRMQVGFGPGCAVADQRLAVFPTLHGQRAVVRLFYEESGLTELEQLGFHRPILDALRRIAGDNQGVLLLTGPAGSGKSTSLAAMLRHVRARFPGKSIVSLEDPVERDIDGVTQVQIPPHGEMTYPVALRSLLRQDPQVLMIGEIRDAETARIVIEAGLTGHLLLTTMHAGQPSTALLRLVEMGVEPYQVTSSVSAVLNQRLVRRLCLACRRGDGAGRHEPVGCKACLATGFRGRALVAEMAEMTRPLREALLAKADRHELDRLLAEQGHIDLRADGRRLVEQGVTSQGEMQSLLGSGSP
jgi:type II secretory ATPase GspE/PulE/Tfp pilus assembly ATPase PilB-like protein